MHVEVCISQRLGVDYVGLVRCSTPADISQRTVDRARSRVCTECVRVCTI